MHFRTVASLAALACASHAAAEPQPYRLAMMAVPGMSLMRRDTSGYQPEQTVCGSGDTCAEACGAGYVQCPSSEAAVHCFNPAASQSCCTDNSGNSCDAGYYCTHDSSANTWCCPAAMDLAECAAAYSATSLVYATSTSTSSTSTSTTSTTTTTSCTTSTTAVTTTAHKNTTTPCTTSSYSSTAWVSSNSTSYAASHSTPATATSAPSTVPTGSSAANANSVSALLLAAVGLLAFL